MPRLPSNTVWSSTAGGNQPPYSLLIRDAQAVFWTQYRSLVLPGSDTPRTRSPRPACAHGPQRSVLMREDSQPKPIALQVCAGPWAQKQQSALQQSIQTDRARMRCLSTHRPAPALGQTERIGSLHSGRASQELAGAPPPYLPTPAQTGRAVGPIQRHLAARARSRSASERARGR